MKHSTVFIANAVIALLYAAGWILVPEMVTSFHGVASTMDTSLIGRYFGVTLVGIGMVTWFARNSDASKAREALTLGLVFHNIAGLILSLHSTLTGQLNAMGWIPVGCYLLLLLGYGYLQFR